MTNVDWATGSPTTWLDDVRGADEDSLLDLADHLPAEAAEALLELATGGTPDRPMQATAGTDAFTHPDAQRRFRLVENVDELERALEFPWEKWTVFLHPAQRRIVDGAYNGPARVSGSAGTGKTIVALHRAVHLARAHPDARVLLATFSETLANALRERLGRLVHKQPSIAKRLEVHSMGGIGRRLYEANMGDAHPGFRRGGSRADRPSSSRNRGSQVQPAFPLDRMEQGGRRVAA